MKRLYSLHIQPASRFLAFWISLVFIIYKAFRKLLLPAKAMVLLLIFLFSASFVQAATITSTATGGAWATTTTWVGNSVPQTTDSVIIINTATVTIASGVTQTCGGINIAGTLSLQGNGSTLNVFGGGTAPVTIGCIGGNGTIAGYSSSSGGTNVVLNGHWSFNGTINYRVSLYFNGSINQKVTAVPSSSFRNIFLQEGSSTTLTFTVTPNYNNYVAVNTTGTIVYNGVAQTVLPTNGGGTYAYYTNLTLAGSGSKTMTNVTVNGVLSMEGTATASAAAYGSAATLRYNTATARTAGAEWITPFAATGGVIIDNTGAITLNAAKVFNASIPLTINSGATLNTSSTSNFQLTFGGDFNNNSGTFTANASPIVIANTMATQSIDGFTTTGLVSMTKTAGTATFHGNVNGAGLTISGSGGTLNLGTGLTHTFTGIVTLTAGTLNGGSSTLNENAVSTTAWNGTGTVFTAGTGTVNFGAAGDQTLSASTTTFNNVTFSNSGTKTTTGAVIVNGTLTTNNLTLALGNNLTINGTFSGGTSTLKINTTLTVAVATTSGNNCGQIDLTTANAVLTYGGVGTLTCSSISFGANSKLTFSGSGTLACTGNVSLSSGNQITCNSGTFNCTGNISGAGASGTTLSVTTGSFSCANIGLTSSSTVSIGTGTFSCNDLTYTSSATLSFTGAGTLNVSGAITHAGLAFTPNTGTVNFNGAAQSVPVLSNPYYNLTLTGSGTTKTLGGAVTTNGALTINSGVTLAMSTYLLTLNGDLINNGGSTSGSGGVTIGGTATQSIGAFTTTGTVTMTKTGGTATFAGNMSSGALTVNGTGGTLELAAGYTYTYSGTTTISAGTLRLGAANLIPDNAMTLGGGTLSTGSGAGFSETIGTLNMSVSSAISLGTGVHTLTIISSTSTWAGTTLTINGWTGLGGSGGTATAGKIMVGVGGLTSTQLGKIAFSGGYPTGAVITASGELVPSSGAIGTTFYSKSSSTPETPGNWNTARNGTGTNAVATDFTAGNIFVIQNGHTMTTSAAWSVSGTNSKVQIENGGILVSTAAITLATTTTFQLDNGGTYRHNNTSAPSTTIFNGTESFGASSNVRIDNWTSAATVITTGVTLPFGNLELNWNPGGTWAQGLTGTVNLTAGNFTITTLNGNELRLTPATTGTALTLGIGGNLSIANGILSLIGGGSAGTKACNVNVTGDVSMSGTGVIDMNSNTSTSGAIALNVGGNFSVSGTSVLKSTTGTGTKTVNFNNASGNQTFSSTASGINTSVITFNIGTGSTTNTLQLLSNFVMNNTGSLNVLNKATLNCGSYIVQATIANTQGNFTLNSGGTIMIGSTAGITSSGATGNIQTATTRSFNTGANYIYNGTGGAQTTGTGLPSTVSNLTISNTAGVTLAASKIITNNLSISSGSFANLSTFITHTASTLTLGGASAASGSWGSTSSTATHKDDAYFAYAGTGKITVAHSDNDYFRSKASGNWSAIATWESSPDNSTWISAITAPTNAAALITIVIGHTVTIDVNSTASSLVINGRLDGGSASLDVSGNWTNNGTFTAGTSTVKFTGLSITQEIGGTQETTFYNFTGEKTNGEKLKTNVTVNGIMELDYSAGYNTLEINAKTLTLNGTFTGPGSITGDINAILTIGGSTGGDLGTLLFTSGAEILNTLTLNRTGSNPAATIGTNLKIGSGGLIITSGVLSIDFAKALTVAGSTALNYSSSPCLVLKSDATGTASFIDNGTISGTGNASVERYIANDWHWHLLSSPIAAQAIWPAFAPDPGGGLNFGTPWNWDFYYFNPNAKKASELFWVNLRKANGDYNSDPVDQTGSFAGFGSSTPPAFTVGRGYLVAYNTGWSTGSPTTHSFTGALNTGTVNRAVVVGQDSLNLVGNPYPSAIDWKAASGWGRSNLKVNGGGNDYWVWNETYGNYGVFNSAGSSGTNGTSQYISPAQGFFVKISSGPGNLSMNNSVRVHSTQSWLKDGNAETSLIRLKLTSDTSSYNDEMIVDINPAYTGGGSDKFSSFYTEAPEIYSVKDGNKYSIDRYSDLNQDLTVNIGTKTGVAANYTITATNISDFTLSSKVLLEDLKTGITTNLKQISSYSFAGAPADDPNRFRLIIGSPLGVEEKTSDGFNIYTYEKMVYVQNNKSTEPYKVIVSDMLGQIISQTSFTGNSLNRIPLNRVLGVYIVTVVSKGQTISKKVVIR